MKPYDRNPLDHCQELIKDAVKLVNILFRTGNHNLSAQQGEVQNQRCQFDGVSKITTDTIFVLTN